MDQLSNITDKTIYLLPWATFVAALMGSLHCMGMCGGLVVACSSSGDKSSNIFYQIGRLLSYSMLGLIAGLIGQSFNISNVPKWVSIIPAIFIGLLFLSMGISILKGRKLDFKLPKMFETIQRKLFRNALTVKSAKLKSFLVGTFSIMLPCGFLYGIVFTVMAFQQPLWGFLALITFWMGTLPAMGLAPNLINKFLRPLIAKKPILVSFTFIFIGLLTMTIRVVNFYGQTTGHSCH